MKILLILLLVRQISALTLECKYVKDESFEEFKEMPFRCYIVSANVQPNGTTIFLGSKEEKQKVTVVDFKYSKVSAIPAEITENFPNLNGLMIRNSDMRTINTNYFKKNLEVLKYLRLSNKLMYIYKNALYHLKNLVWLDVHENNLQVLQTDVFSNNPNLKYLNFQNNRIYAISSRIFDNLKKLEKVKFEPNSCIHKDFDLTIINNDVMMSSLANCFESCKMIPHCLIDGETPKQYHERIMGYANSSKIYKRAKKSDVLKKLKKLKAIAIQAKLSSNTSVPESKEKGSAITLESNQNANILNTSGEKTVIVEKQSKNIQKVKANREKSSEEKIKEKEKVDKKEGEVKKENVKEKDLTKGKETEKSKEKEIVKSQAKEVIKGVEKDKISGKETEKSNEKEIVKSKEKEVKSKKVENKEITKGKEKEKSKDKQIVKSNEKEKTKGKETENIKEKEIVKGKEKEVKNTKRESKEVEEEAKEIEKEKAKEGYEDINEPEKLPKALELNDKDVQDIAITSVEYSVHRYSEYGIEKPEETIISLQFMVIALIITLCVFGTRIRYRNLQTQDLNRFNKVVFPSHNKEY